MNPTLGRQMEQEMAEQPRVLAALAEQLPDWTSQIKALTRRGVAGVAFLARGSSDNAALFGRYAVELHTGLPTCLIAPSLITAYGRQPVGFRGWLLVAASQSGRTPEIVDLARAFSAAGASVVSITNDGASELAAAGAVSIDVAAGPERAVPATKTVTAQMMAMTAIVSGLASVDLPPADRISEAVRFALEDRAAVAAAAEQLDGVDRVAIVGRGLVYPAARETALKLQETTGMMAHGFSTADFRHGPIAVCGPDAPAVLFMGAGPADRDTQDLVAPLQQRSARTVLIGHAAAPDIGLPDLGGAADCVLSTVRGQQLALALCRQRGIDPDHPAGLNKITLTH